MIEKLEIEYGRIELANENIIRVIGGPNPLELKASELKVIGEFTTDNGPFIDDWFLTLITAENWVEIPMYTPDMEPFLTKLGHLLRTNLKIQFANSSEWKTRIIYPNEFAEKELYEFKDIQPKTTWTRLKAAVDITENVRKLSEFTLKAMTE